MMLSTDTLNNGLEQDRYENPFLNREASGRRDQLEARGFGVSLEKAFPFDGTDLTYGQYLNRGQFRRTVDMVPLPRVTPEPETGGALDIFKTIDVPSGSNPVATTSTDTLFLTSSDASIAITGDSGTKTVDFIFNTGTDLFFLAADSGSPETVASGDTMLVTGGTGISTSITGADTVTIDSVWDTTTGLVFPASAGNDVKVPDNDSFIVGTGNDGLFYSTGLQIFIEQTNASQDIILRNSTNGSVLIGQSIADRVELASGLGGNQQVQEVQSLVRCVADEFAPTFAWGKSRGTYTTPLAVVDNDDIGVMEYQGFDGTNWIQTAKLHVKVNQVVAANTVASEWRLLVNKGGGDTTADYGLDIYAETSGGKDIISLDVVDLQGVVAFAMDYNTTDDIFQMNGNTISIDATNDHVGFGTATPNTAVDVASDMAIRENSPTQITSDQNNYNTNGYSVLRLTSDASRTITGFANGVQGKFLYVFNVGSQDIIIANQNGSSTDVNRVITGTSSDITLTGDESLTLWYDSITARWRGVNIH